MPISLAASATTNSAYFGADKAGPITEEAYNEIVEQASAAPAKAIKRIDKLLPDQEARIRLLLLAVRGSANLNLGKAAEAAKDFDAAHAIDTTSEFPGLMRFASGLDNGNGDFAADGLDQMIAVAPDAVRELEAKLIYAYLREFKGARADDQMIELARIGYGGLDNSEMIEAAVGILLDRGNIDDARDLLTHLHDVSVARSMLVNRRYEPLWAVLEARAGDRFVTIGKESLDAAQSANAAEPENLRNRAYLIAAYASLGRYGEADEAGRSIGATAEAMKALDEDGGWAVNAHAMALFAAGRKTEADARFAALNLAQAETGWIISMLINRVELLARARNFEAADKALAIVEHDVQTKGNNYAKQLVRRIRLCTLHGLGRSQEVATLLPDFRAHADDAKGASVEGYMCLGETAAAKELVLELLADRDWASSTILDLQRNAVIRADPSAWSEYWTALRGDADIEAAFQKYGRDLPERFRIHD